MYGIHGQSGSPIATERLSQGGSMRRGFLHSAHDFVLQNPIMVEQTVYQNYSRDVFENSIAKLSTYTIRGAEYNSSARDPPPLCHPGTRLNILQRINNWFHDLGQGKRILWLCGPAGVGKSAIIQTLAESLAEGHQQNLQLGATIFFSRPNYRDNPLLVFTTIAHQLAIQYPPYREFIQKEFASNPTLAEKSLTETFKRFLVKPFGQQQLCRATGPLVISLDGLDECEGERRQGEIITLIGGFVAEFPSVPLLWMISSRPEPHLSVAFSRDLVQRACWKEEIPIDSDDACQDVEHYLREAFEEIRQNYHLSFPPTSRWPDEHQFLKVSTASAGLFAFATTITRFLDDPQYGNPVAQFNKVLAVIEEARQPVRDGQPVNPFSTLDALYTRILSSIPPDVLATIARILRQITFPHPSFVSLSNFLGLAQHDAYGALQRLHSVVRVPPLELAHIERMEVYHTSFTDYLRSEARSGSFWLLKVGGWDDHLECNKRILGEANGVASSKIDVMNVALSWPTQDVEKTKMYLYQKALTWLPSDYINASETARQQHLAGVLQILAGIDPGDLPLPEVDFTRLLLEVQKSPLFEELVAHKIMQLVPISHLDLSQLKKEKLVHTYCEQIGDVPILDFRGFEFVDDYSYHVSDDGEIENAKKHSFHHAMGSLSSENMGQVLADLDYVRSNLPSTMVTIFGVSSKRIVMFERELIPGVQVWHYAVPYGPL